MDNKKITVCDNCFRASCYHGKFYCDEYREAGIINIPIWVLEKLELENPDNWKGKQICLYCVDGYLKEIPEEHRKLLMATKSDIGRCTYCNPAPKLSSDVE